MNYGEQPLAIPLPDGQAMLGILSLPLPPAPAPDIALVIVVGGAQYRVGSHRQFVTLARHLAQAGYAVLRFDFPGMGDSPGAPLAFEHSHIPLGAAISALRKQQPQANRVVLWGLCDGASASLLYLQAQPQARIAALVLLNPWVRSPTSLARAQVRHYYGQRLLQTDFWRKLLRGGIGWPALRAALAGLRQLRPPAVAAASEHFAARMAQGLAACSGPVLLLLSAQDLTAQEFAAHARSTPEWQRLLASPRVTQQRIEGADHTLSSSAAHSAMQTLLLHWLQTL